MNLENTHTKWREKAELLELPSLAVIDGNLVPSLSEATFSNISPIDGRVISSVASCDAADVEKAVQSARAAFEDGRWSATPPSHRKKILVNFAQLIEAHAEELALLETLDMGKPIGDAMAIDLPACWGTMAWYGEAIDKIYDEIAPTTQSALGLVTREPLGVVACVVPWNFPLLMAIWKIAPALAAGNSVILKPAEQSSMTAIKLGELALQAGLPPGVLNVVPGFGETAGAAIGLHRDVDAIAFTGSTEIGKKFLEYAGQSNMKSVSLECGGKSPNIVMADCPDLDAAATAAAFAVFFNQGEVCSAGTRLLVERSIQEEFMEKVTSVTNSMVVGDPLCENTTLGAMVSEEQMDRVLSYLEIGMQEGANFVLPGGRVHQESNGFYLKPTIIDGVAPKSRVAQEEIFGPVLCAIPFETTEEAIAIANDSIYGLAAGVWTSNLNTAHKMARNLRAGTVWVNNYDGSDVTVPFGGYRQSGNGRDKSLHAFDKYTQLKTTWISLQ